MTSKYVKNLNEAVKAALGLASRGDIILFSPAFAHLDNLIMNTKRGFVYEDNKNRNKMRPRSIKN